MPLKKRERLVRGACILLTLGAIGFGCHSHRSKFAPTSDPPEPPEGNGWFCFHATSPHDISSCKRDLKSCTKARDSFAADKTEMIQRDPEKPRSQTSLRPVSEFFAMPQDGDGPPDKDEPEPYELPERLEDICSIDPRACRYVDTIRQSVPTYSSCAPKDRAYCAAYYHEFNYYRRDEDTIWRFFCAEDKESCENWREVLHLHLAKRPCELVK